MRPLRQLLTKLATARLNDAEQVDGAKLRAVYERAGELQQLGVLLKQVHPLDAAHPVVTRMLSFSESVTVAGRRDDRAAARVVAIVAVELTNRYTGVRAFVADAASQLGTGACSESSV